MLYGYVRIYGNELPKLDKEVYLSLFFVQL